MVSGGVGRWNKYLPQSHFRWTGRRKQVIQKWQAHMADRMGATVLPAAVARGSLLIIETIIPGKVNMTIYS